MIDIGLKIGSPPAEVVVDVDGRHLGPSRLLFQPSDLLGHRLGELEELISLREFQVIDHVDQEQGDRGFVRGIPMQVLIGRTHDWTLRISSLGMHLRVDLGHQSSSSNCCATTVRSSILPAH